MDRKCPRFGFPSYTGPPKTRSGKLMRRILAAISNRGATGDITTLANPDIVEKVREMVQGKEPVAVGEVAEDIKQFGSQE